MIMNPIVDSVTAEYRRYKALAEGAMEQLDDAALSHADAPNSNSIAVICWHVSGNLASRFSDFLAGDGEKPWRQREEEFAPRAVTRAELLEKWNAGWTVLFNTLGALADGDLSRSVTIRRQPLLIIEALHRSLAHISYHVGQIVLLARSMRGAAWKYLSIPPGQSDAYNARPTMEKAAAHAGALAEASTDRPAGA